MMRRWQTQAATVAVLYVFVSCLWIAGSDWLLSSISQTVPAFRALSTVKGFVFVVVTGLLLFLVLRRLLRTESEARALAEQSAQALRESESKFRQMAETISEVFWSCDLDFKAMHYISPAYETIWGRSRESLLKNPRSWSDAVHPEDRERVVAAFWADRGLKEISVEYRIVRPDGTVRWILDRAFPVRNAGGEAIGIVGLAKDITERKQAERELREREHLYHTVFQSANDGIIILENDRIVDCNERALELFRGTRAELIGAQPSEVSPERQPNGDFSVAGQRFRNQRALDGEPQYFEWQHRRRDGTEFLAEISLRAFSLGPKRLLLALVRDISERKQAEHQLLQLNRVYELISHINEAIVRISQRDALFREACRIAVEHGHFRLAWLGMLDQSTREIVPVASAPQEDRSIQSGTVEALDPNRCEIVRTTLRERRVAVCQDIAQDPQMASCREAALARGYKSVISLPLKVGSRIVGVFGVYAAEPGFFSAIIIESLIEIAANLSFALELFEQNRERELEQQQLRLQHAALEAAANAIVITDRSGVIEWVNNAFSRLTGYSRQEAVGQSPRLLKSEAHDKAFYQRMWQTITAGSVWQGNLTNKRKDGTLFEEEMIITPVRGDSGEITHFVAIKQDVTERRKLEQQFLRAQRTQSIGLLAGGVAHDLNNVLTPVLMALPLLRNHLAPDQRDHILETLEQSVRRGANIVQQVLTFARGVEVQRVLVQLRHLVKEVAKIAEETFPRDIRVQANLPSNLWPFLGDPTQIHQVLLNLAVNARDAMPEGGQLSFTASNVELRERLQFLDFDIPPGRYISLSVADTGTGIAPETMERMFEPFFTTKPAGKGTGLGLSTVLGIVKSHGGLVEVKSRVGAGSTFTVFLPAAPQDASATTFIQNPALPQGRGETLLVVDDETGILQVSKSTLEANGYRVLTAKDGKQALARFAEARQTIDAVVTDIMMPAMDGLGLTRSLRQMNPSVPIVVVTGLMNPPGEEDRAAQLRELGVRHFIYKPFKAEDLLSTLHQVLHPSKAVS